MKATIICTLAVAAILIWGVYCFVNPSTPWEKEQGIFLMIFAIPVMAVLYASTRPRIGR